jgi:hypothetical protein
MAGADRCLGAVAHSLMAARSPPADAHQRGTINDKSRSPALPGERPLWIRSNSGRS